jgi:hypothetical protein
MQPPQLEEDEPSLSRLEALVGSGEVGDRAFVASALALRRTETADDAARAALLYQRAHEAARRAHADLQQRIQRGALGAAELLARLEAAPLELRDHLLEEILDVAYPPLESATRARDVTRHSPSGLSEIAFLLQHAGLGPGKLLVDLGSGFGKVVLLAALSGAAAHGLELDEQLVLHAERAAQWLRLDNASFAQGDIRTTALPDADVYYLFIPFIGSAEVVRRLAPLAQRRRLLLFAQALDLEPLPWLRAAGKSSYWLEMYESR